MAWRAWLLPALLLVQPAIAGPGQVQVVRAGGEVLAGFPVMPGDRWCLIWNHSVAGFEVRDCYIYRKGRMLLERSHQPDFAAGLGHVPGRGVQTPDGAGGYWIERIDEPVPDNRYVLRVGSAAVDHRLVADEIEIPLSAAAAGEAVMIRLLAEP